MLHLYQMRASSPCRAVEMTLKLLGLEYEVHDIDLLKKEQFEPEYMKLNPFHTVPTLVDEDFVIIESRAIMTYLANTYAPDSDLYPKDNKKRAIVDQFLNIDNGTIFARGVAILHCKMYGHEPSEELLSKCKDALGILDNILANKTYITGDTMTLADLSIAMSLTCLQMTSFKYSEFSNITKFESQIRKDLSPMYGEVNDEPIAQMEEYITGVMRISEYI